MGEDSEDIAFADFDQDGDLDVLLLVRIRCIMNC